MLLVLAFDPPNLVHWWPEHRLRESPVTLNVAADVAADGAFRVTLDVTFFGAPLIDERGHLVGALACTEAVVAVSSFHPCVCRDATPPTTLDVEVSYGHPEKRSVELTIKPKVKLGLAEVEPGEVKVAGGVERRGETRFRTRVALQRSVMRGPVAQWRVLHLETPQVGTPFLEGNLHLYAEYDPAHMPKRGTIEITPDKPSLFGTNHRALSALKRAWLRHVDATNYGRVFQYAGPIRTKFEVTVA
jgi:hypothetical protein